MKHILLLLLFSFAATKMLKAQNDTSRRSLNKLKVHSLSSMGIMKGELSEPELQVQSIVGVGHTSWFLGIGAGIDFYENTSIPVFIDIRKNLLGLKNKLFVYADAGVNLPWKKDEKWNGYESVYKHGKYYDAGFGYSIKVLKNAEYVVGLGYTLKEMTNQTKYAYTTNGVLYWMNGTKSTFENRRIILKFGWKF